MKHRCSTTGFSLIETLIVFAVLAIIAVMSFAAFSGFRDEQVLRTSTDTVSSAIEQARSRTLASENQEQYGVRFATSSATIFVGTTYTSGHASNTVHEIDPPAQISSIDLDDGTSQIVFERLTGDASAGGSVTLSLSTDPASTSTVTITKTGIIEIE